MNRGAFLLYRCRACGNVDRSAHVPDGDAAWLVIGGVIASPPGWGWAVKPTSTHACSPKILGMADFAGVEFDEPE